MIQYRPASIDTACSGPVAVAELVRPEPDQREVERRRRLDVHHGVDHRPEQFPVATAISERTLSLPLSPKVSEADQDDVVEAMTELLT